MPRWLVKWWLKRREAKLLKEWRHTHGYAVRLAIGRMYVPPPARRLVEIERDLEVVRLRLHQLMVLSRKNSRHEAFDDGSSWED